jgi:hypothetical protein
MIIVPGVPELPQTRHSRELNKQVDDVVRDYRRNHPDVTDGEVRAALLRSSPAGELPGVARRKMVAGVAVGAAMAGAFAAMARSGGTFAGATGWMIGGIVVAVLAIAIAVLRIAQRD